MRKQAKNTPEQEKKALEERLSNLTDTIGNPRLNLSEKQKKITQLLKEDNTLLLMKRNEASAIHKAISVSKLNEKKYGTALIRFLVEYDERVLSQDFYGLNLLEYTALFGNTSSMTYLRKEKKLQFSSRLIAAAYNGEIKKLKKVSLQKIIHNHCLHYAIAGTPERQNSDSIAYLLNLTPHPEQLINQPLPNGDTALHIACRIGDTDLVKKLLSLNANLDAKNHYEYTPLHLAAENDFVNIARVLLKNGIDRCCIDLFGNTPINLAVWGGHLNTTDCLLEQKANPSEENQNNHTLLHTAVYAGHIRMLDLLLERGLELEARNQHNETPLHAAAICGNVVIALFLLHKGANLQALHEYGTPLHFALLSDHTELVRHLLPYTASFTTTDSRENTLLHLAARCGHLNIVRLLLSYGAKLELNNQSGKTPLFLACEYGHHLVVRLLLEKGANLDIQANTFLNPKPLYKASKNGHVNVAQELIKQTTKQNWMQSIGVACSNGHADVASLLLQHIKKTLKLNYRKWRQALQYACIEGNVSIVCLLLENGADLKTVYRMGRYEYTPLSFACSHAHVDLVHFILTCKFSKELLADREYVDQIRWQVHRDISRGFHRSELPKIAYLFYCFPLASPIGWVTDEVSDLDADKNLATLRAGFLGVNIIPRKQARILLLLFSAVLIPKNHDPTEGRFWNLLPPELWFIVMRMLIRAELPFVDAKIPESFLNNMIGSRLYEIENRLQQFSPDHFTALLVNNTEVALLIFQLLSIRDLINLSCTNKTFRNAALDKALWKKHHTNWKNYLLLPFRPTIQYRYSSNITAFKNLYLSTARQRRIVIDATLSGDRDKIKILHERAITPFRGFGLQRTWMYPLLRDQCIINAALDGDTVALEFLKCAIRDIKKLALISRSRNSDHRQPILDFFWRLVLATYHYAPITPTFEHPQLEEGGLTLAHWSVILNQPEALKNYLQANSQHISLPPNLFGITLSEWAEYFQHENCIRVLTHKKQTSDSKSKLSFKIKKLTDAFRTGDFESSLVILNRNNNLTSEELSEFTMNIAAKGFIEHLYLLLSFLPDSSNQVHKDLALLAAAGHGHSECVNFLLQQNANPNIFNNYRSPRSTREPHLCGDRGDTPLTFASKNGHTECVRLLLANGSHINAKNFRGDTALIRAAYRGYIDILKLLIQHGANPHVTDDYGNTTVMGAARGKHNESLETLLALGVDPNRQNQFGDTPLMRAAYRGHLSCLEQLLNGDADPLLKNNEGKTALDLSVEQSHQNGACLLAVAMFLFSLDTKVPAYHPNLFSKQDAHMSLLQQAKICSPNYFRQLMEQFIKQPELYPWVTQEMFSYLLNMEIAHQLEGGDTSLQH